MPEMRFRIRWPDGSSESCYSPSLVVKDHLVVGETYALDDFLERCRVALHCASERVEARYGRPCAFALAQLAALETRAALLSMPAGSVFIEAFEIGKE